MSNTVNPDAVVATFEDLTWQYVGFTCRLARLGPPETIPPEESR